MLLTKNFVMLKAVLCIALMKCLLLQYSLADDVTTYGFRLQDRFSLEIKNGNPSKAKIILDATVNTKPHPIRPNTFVAAIEDLEVTLVAFGMIERVHECKDFAKIAPTFKLPFLIKKTKKNAIFQSVTVSKNDDITSKSLKRMIGIKFQLNEVQVRRTKEKQFTKLSVEHTNYGRCDIQYKAKKREDRGDDWWIDINYFKSYCNDRDNKTNPDSEYLKGFCNMDPENKLKFEENGRSIVHLDGDKLTYKTLTRNYQGNYLPWKGAPGTQLFQYIDSRLGLRENAKGGKVPDFDETNMSEIVKDNLYIPVTRRHISEGESDALRNIYKALACEPEYYSLFLSLMDYSIRCYEF